MKLKSYHRFSIENIWLETEVSKNLGAVPAISKVKLRKQDLKLKFPKLGQYAWRRYQSGHGSLIWQSWAGWEELRGGHCILLLFSLPLLSYSSHLSFCAFWYFRKKVMPIIVQFETTLDTNKFSIFVPPTKVYVSRGRRRITRSKLRFPPGQEFTLLVPQSPRPLGEFSSFALFPLQVSST